VLEELAELVVAARDSARVWRVAIDGTDGAGKTTLADELAAALRERGKEVVRMSVDDFHRPEEERYARGRLSPVGYYEDSFDHERFRAALLPVDRGLVVVDGVFLQRPELDGCWHLRAWIDVSEAEALRRALGRDEQYHETRAEIVELYERRYQPGQRLYRDAVDPRARADVVFENEDPAEPRLVRAVHTSGAES